MTKTRPARVERLSYRGHGLVRIAGRMVPVPGALPGELVEVGPVGGTRGRLVARLLRVLEAAPERIDPACDQAARCPGCALRHVAPGPQRAMKCGLQVDAVMRIARPSLPAPPVALAGAPVDGYRARVVASWLGDRLGMRAHHGAPIDLTRCPVQTPASRELLARIAGEIDRLDLGPALHEVRAEVTDLGHAQVLLAFTTAPDLPRLAEAFLADDPDLALHAALVRPGDRRAAVRVQHLRGPTAISFRVGGDRLRATFPAWTPHVPSSLDTLRARVVDALALDVTAEVVEIGCGVGTLSVAVARRARALVGVDQERPAVADAAANARLAGACNAHFRVGRAEHALRRLAADRRRPSHALLHAMRRPFGAAAMAALRALDPERVVYLAPSPPALARDLVELGARYGIEDLRFVDQLPGTPHLLAVCTLRRRGGRR